MKEAQIRSKEMMDRYLSLSAKDASTFFTAPRAAIACVGCGAQQSAMEFEKSGFAYALCQECGTLFQSPRPPMSEFAKFYNDSPSSTYWAETFFPAVAEKRRELIFAPRAEKITALCQKKQADLGLVIDVGAGYGIFLEEWKRINPASQVCAIEPGAKLAQICRDKGLEVLEEVVENSDAWAGRAGLVVSFEVIEHVHDVLKFAQAIYRLLRPGGTAVVSGLGVDGFDIQVLWEHSNSVSPPHHINFLSTEGFTRLFAKAGFSAVEVQTPGRLDVDIVKGRTAGQPELLRGQRFVRQLLQKSEDTQADFQEFLSKHGLSSHAWIIATK